MCVLTKSLSIYQPLPSQETDQSVIKDDLPKLSIQSCEMSILLHGAKCSNQILSQEKRANRDNSGTFCEQNKLKG